MPQQHRFTTPVLAATSALTLLLAGCAATVTRGPNGSPLPEFVAGNWQVRAQAQTGGNLPAISGALSGNSGAIAGIFHSNAQNACIAPADAFKVTGSSDASGNVTLSGPLAGGTLTVSGTLAADGKSLSNATYNVAGGSCGFAKAAIATAQVYMPISGVYTGSFADASGQVATVQATLNQSPDANGDGNYTLSGSASPNSPCFAASVPISNTTVTGGAFTFTYTDSTTANSVTATGTFSSDASTLNSIQWTSSGPCGADTGTGSMSRQ